MSATEQHDSVMGHDPLAWIAQEADDNDASPPVAEMIEPEATPHDVEMQDETQAEMPEAVVGDATAASEAPFYIEEHSEAQGEAPKAVETAIALAEQAASGEVLVLEGDMGIANINDWHATFREALLTHAKITIQAEALSHVDTAALQLLYAFQRSAKASEVEVVWQGIPDAVRETAEMIALADAMDW